MEKLRASEDMYVRLARASVEHFVRTHTYVALPPDMPKELTEGRAGAFVSIKKYGKLRGCIGTFLPAQQSLAEEILYNAVSAAAHDSRFEPIAPEELDRLVYSVDVLSTPEPITSAEELDPHVYGVIVKSAADRRRGLLLPDLAGIDTAEQQIAIAREKAHIMPKEPISLARFTVVRHH